MSFLNQAVSQSFAIDLIDEIGAGHPLANCTPITLTFQLVNAEPAHEYTPMPLVFDLFLLEGIYTITDGPGLTETPPLVNIGGDPFENWRTTVMVPSWDDGAITTISVTLVITGNLSGGQSSIFYQGTGQSGVLGLFAGPHIDPNFAVTVGNLPTDETLLSAVATGNTGQLNLPPGGGSANDVLINGKLLVDVDYIFDQNQKLYMGANSSIEILGGNTLQLLGQVNISGCLGGWDGIDVLSGATLVIDGSADNSTPLRVDIADATTAVTAHDGATVNINDCHFMRNDVSIRTPESPGAVHGIDFSITNNTFEIGTYGLEMNDVQLVSSSSNNVYRDMLVGILGLRSSIFSVGDHFENLGEGITMSGGGAEFLSQVGPASDPGNPNFINCGRAVGTDNVRTFVKDNSIVGAKWGINVKNLITNGYFSQLFVVNNYIEATIVGIHLGRVSSTSVDPDFDGGFFSNKIVMSGNGAFGAGILSELASFTNFFNNEVKLEDGRYGIYSNSGGFCSFAGNVVSLKGANAEEGFTIVNSPKISLSGNAVYGNSSTAQIGLRMVSSPSTQATCNCFDETDFGSYFFDDSSPLTLQGNTFTQNSSFGMKVGDVGGTGPIVAYIGEQFHNGNTWGGWSSFGAVNYGFLSDLADSKFIVNAPEGTALHPPVLTPNVLDGADEWFVDDIGNTFVCGGTLADCPTPSLILAPDTPTEVPTAPDTIRIPDIKVADGTFMGHNFPEAQAWKAKRHLYRRLAADPALLGQSTVVSDFYDQNQNTSVGGFEKVAAEIAAAQMGNGATASSLMAVSAQMQTDIEALITVEQGLAADPAPTEEQALLAQKAQLKQGLTTLAVQSRTLAAALGAERTPLLVQAQLHNEEVTATAVYEINEQDVNRISLEAMLADGEYTEAQLSELELIAAQCPLAGGDAVYRARAMLGDAKPYDDVLLCGYDSGQALAKPPGTDDIRFSIAPNPARDYLMVELENPSDEDGRLSIFDHTGRQVYKQLLPAEMETVAVLLPGLPSGLYTLVLEQDGHRASPQKFVVAR